MNFWRSATRGIIAGPVLFAVCCMALWFLPSCSDAAKPATTDPLEALAQCVRDAGLTNATNVDSDEAKHAMWLICPELVEHP